MRLAISFGSMMMILAIVMGATPSSAASTQGAEQLLENTLQLEGDAARGAALFERHCVSCHGAKAQGDARRMIPTLAGQRRAYLIKQFVDFAGQDRVTTRMHAVIARTEIDAPKAWADLASFLNGLAPTLTPEIGSGRYLSLGEADYEQWCSSCHEEDARGDEDGFVPSLRNQHYGYLLQEMDELAAGHRLNVESDLVRFMSGLEADEKEGLADYLSRMHGPVRDRARLHNDGTVGD